MKFYLILLSDNYLKVTRQSWKAQATGGKMKMQLEDWAERVGLNTWWVTVVVIEPPLIAFSQSIQLQNKCDMMMDHGKITRTWVQVHISTTFVKKSLGCSRWLSFSFSFWKFPFILLVVIISNSNRFLKLIYLKFI